MHPKPNPSDLFKWCQILNVQEDQSLGPVSVGMEEPTADNTDTKTQTPPQEDEFGASCASEHYGCCLDDTTHNSCAREPI